MPVTRSSHIQRRIFAVYFLPALLLILHEKAEAQFTFTTNNGTLTITAYTGSGGEVIIPDTINGWPVTSIGDSAFKASFDITSVTIPNSILSIGVQAFSDCSGITNISIGGNVIIIGQDAFSFCSSLSKVMIPSGVTSIGNGAFYGCDNMTDVFIGSSVTNIGGLPFTGPGGQTMLGNLAFVWCPALQTITIDQRNQFYSSTNGIMFDKQQSKIVLFPGGVGGSYTIPDNVTDIGFEAFASGSLTNITVPSGITNIGEYAFVNCASLVNVTIGSGVTSIGRNVFDECTSLTGVTISNGVTSLGDYMFYYCINLASITIPSSVTNIGKSAFYDCVSLTNIYFSGNAPAAGAALFVGDNLTAYYLPGTIGWSNTFSGMPTALWLPRVLTSDGAFGVQTNRFGFNINWASGKSIVVEASTGLASFGWVPMQTNTLTSDTLYFSDPQWTNYPNRFYRIRSP